MKKYPKYKESGVEWLGEIPSEWATWKVSRLFKKIGSGTTPKAGTPEYYENGTIPWINTGDLNNGYISDCSSYITQKAFDDHSTLKIYEAGTLLVAMYGATIGKIAITKFEACTNQACCSLVSSKRTNTKFAFYWFIANKENIINLSYGGGQPNISQDIVRSLKIPICNLSEQLSIVQFLDHKTNQIDRFIANRQKQIELLKEQKAAIINKAVTKGIGSLSVSTERSRSGVETPNVKMKDSGIEWIGEVPEHWRKLRLKNIAKRITNGFVGSTSNILQENGVRYIQALHVKQNKILFNQPYYVSEKWSNEHPRSILKEGDIVITQTGAMTGDVGLVASEFEGSNCHALIIVKPEKRKIIPEFLLSLLTSNFGKSLLFSIRTGSMHPHLNSTIVCDIYLPIPEVLLEQQSIIDFINNETSTIDTLITKYLKQIDLMQEYRTVLISQAVTGKIDVRDWKPKTKKYKAEGIPMGMAAEKPEVYE